MKTREQIEERVKQLKNTVRVLKYEEEVEWCINSDEINTVLAQITGLQWVLNANEKK